MEKNITKDREYKLNSLKEALNDYEKLSINGKFGSGKSYIIELLKKNNEEKLKKSKDKIIQINAYQSNDNILENFINNIKSSKIWKIRLFTKFGWGQWLKKFDKLIFIFIDIIAVILISIFSVFYSNDKFYGDSKWFWLVGIAGFLIFLGIIFVILERYIIYDYNPDFIIKFNISKKMKKNGNKIIFIIDDLNRLNAKEQLIFFNKISYFFEQLNYGNKKIIYLFDDVDLSNEDCDLTKFIDFSLTNINDALTIKEIIIDIVNKNTLNIKVTSDEIINILNNFEHKSEMGPYISYLNYISTIDEMQNIRNLIYLVKKLDFYLRNKEFSNKVFIPDILDFILLEIINPKFYKSIIKKPDDIFFNNIFKSGKDKDGNQLRTEFGEKILKEKKDEFKSEFEKFAETILRKQDTSKYPYLNSTFYPNNKQDTDLLRITNYQDFYFFKYPTRFNEYLNAISPLKSSVENVGEINIDTIISFFNQDNNILSKFPETTISMCLDIMFTSIKDINIISKKNYNNVVKKLIKLKFNEQNSYHSGISQETWYKLLDYFLIYFNKFIAEDIWELTKKENLNIYDYQFIFTISEKNVSWFTDLFGLNSQNWEELFNSKKVINKNEVSVEIDKINRFYKKHYVPVLIGLNPITIDKDNINVKMKIDDFLDKIYLISASDISKFIKNILNLDYQWCRLLAYSIYKSEKYSGEIKAYLSKISLDNPVSVLIKSKGVRFYKDDFISKNRYSDSFYRFEDDDIFINFYNDYEHFFI